VTGADERAQRIRDGFATPDVQAADAALNSLLAELDLARAVVEAAEAVRVYPEGPVGLEELVESLAAYRERP
jgi:hypothetical protein